MAKQVVFGRQATYPWDKWFSYVNQFTLRKGKDYSCRTHSMAMQFRAKAAIRGIKVHIHQEDESLTIKVDHKTKKGVRSA